MLSRPFSLCQRPSSRRKPLAKLRPIMPPDLPMIRIWSSVRLREEAQRAWAFEWVATMGALLWRATSQKPFSLRWETSTMIFSSLQRRTSALPASVRPGPVSGEEGKRNGTPWPKALGRLQTRPSDRSPALCSTSSDLRSVSIASAPSIWKIAATCPAATAARRSATLRQTLKRPPEASSMRNSREAMPIVAARAAGWTMSRAIGGFMSSSSSSSPSCGLGAKIAKNPPAKPPLIMRGRSIWPWPSPSRKSLTGSPCFLLHRRSSTSLWPSNTDTKFSPHLIRHGGYENGRVNARPLPSVHRKAAYALENISST